MEVLTVTRWLVLSFSTATVLTLSLVSPRPGDLWPCSQGSHHTPTWQVTVRAEWRQTAEMRERALAQRHMAKKEELTRGTKHLPPLQEGDTVMIQDQSTHKPGRWTKTGRIVEVLEFDSYLVKIDGSNHVTKRNRKFLRKFSTFIEKVAGPDIPSPRNAPPPHPTPNPAPSAARATPPSPPSSPSDVTPGLSSAETATPIEQPATPRPTPIPPFP